MGVFGNPSMSERGGKEEEDCARMFEREEEEENSKSSLKRVAVSGIYGRQVMIHSHSEDRRRREKDAVRSRHHKSFGIFEAANDVSIEDNKTRAVFCV